MKQVHNKARKLYKTYSYNIANLKFMKQIHKIIKYPIFPGNSIKLVHVELNESFVLLTSTMIEQLLNHVTDL